MKHLRFLGKFWRAETGFFFALWLVLLVGARSRLFQDPGTFWHTVVGEQILSTGQFPDTDSFSYTFYGKPWIPHQWLGECTMALLNRVAEFDTLLLGAATLLAGLFSWVGARLVRAGLHWSLAAVLLLLAVGASSSHFHIRPHLGTMLFLAVTFALLCDVEAGRARLRRLCWLLPVFLLWTNTHGGMLGGWCTLALVFTHWSISWALGRFTPLTSLKQVGLVYLLLLGCGLTCLINPYGYRMPLTWLEIMDSNILPQIIIEHAPLRPGSAEGIMVLLFAAVYLFALAGLRPQWPRACWIVPVVWFVLAVSRIRHSPLFALTALLALAEIVPQTRWAVWAAESGHDLFRPPSAQRQQRWHWRAAVLPALAVGLALTLQWYGVALPVVGQGWARLDQRIWPVELRRELRDCQIRGRTRPIFNEYAYGGFLIYYTPGLKVFVDDRCELYGDQWLLKFVMCEIQDTTECMRVYQHEYPFDLALTRTGSGYDNYFRDRAGWKVVKATDTATLYRQEPKGN